MKFKLQNYENALNYEDLVKRTRNEKDMASVQ
jgi:hypothetical protein